MLLFRPNTVGRRVLRSVALAAALSAPALAHAQTGTITGRVTASAGGAPLVESRVYIIGTNTVSSTGADGRYTLRASPGSHDVRVIRVGYSEQKRTVTVTAGGTTTLDFALNASVVKLSEVVTTATGETQRRVELGNSVQTLGNIAQHVEQRPVTNLADLMVGKAPGVQVLGGNMTGSAPVVRIRGIKSLSLSSDPIYIIDGIRMNSSTAGINTGGTQASLLNVINPEEIADIEIVKGPSAATLYGTDAANGVIVITTKRGVAGPARWTAHAGYGNVEDRNNYPKTYAIFGHSVSSTGVVGGIARCTLVTVSAGTCAPDSTTSYDIFHDQGITPLATGQTKQLGLQAAGGSDIVRYFVSGDYEGERGPLELPAFSQRFLDSTGNALRESWIHPENFSRKSFRGNLNSALNPKLDLAFNSGFTRTSQQLPPVDNNSFGFLYNALNNPGFKPTVACQTNKVSCLGYSNVGRLGEELGGYGFYTPGNTFQRLNSLAVDRFISSGNGQWRPLTWLNADATLGLDIAARDVVAQCRFNECPNSGTTRQGFILDARTTDHNYSAKGSLTGTWQARENLNLRTTLGTDYVNLQTEFASAEGDNLPPGAQTAGAGAQQFAGSQFTRANKTLGYYAQEQLALNDRLFVTLAARRDQNSAFGTQFQNVIYPKASVSYIVSEEPFFPRYNFLNQLRLRASYGASGVQPGSTTALQTYGASSANLGATGVAALGTDTPGLLAAALGNPDLKPERSAERELGFDTRMFDSRVNFEFTYYNNLTKDALVNQPIAASSGASSTGLTTAPTVTRNLGSVRNSGIEATLTTTVLDTRNFGWDFTVGGSHNTNKIESLGFQSCTVNTTDCLTGQKPNPTIGTGANRDSLGMDIRGIYARPYTYNDANGDGIITANEVVVDPNVSYFGSAIPRDLVTIQNGFDLFQKKLHLSVLFDYKGGFSLFNNSTQFFCLNTNTCYDETHAAAGSSFTGLTQNGTTSLDDQARLVAMRYANPNTPANQRFTTTSGYQENGQFWRLREVGATVTVPQSVASAMQARDASLTFSGRNLHVWTKYKGTDPESNYNSTQDATGNVQTDFATLAPPTYFTLRLNLHY
jgi:TonB-linked SusC/RagA family outer membrane protein